jgi:hypothetical protein
MPTMPLRIGRIQLTGKSTTMGEIHFTSPNSKMPILEINTFFYIFGISCKNVI